jgi:hypothetical protein
MLNQDIAFNTLQFGVEQTKPRFVDILIAGSSIGKIVGPTPLVDITKTFENDDGYLSTVVETINLTGKIVESGIVNTVSKIGELQKLLKCSSTSIQIVCDDDNSSPQTIYARSGVIVKNANFNKTDNNWTRTIDFSIDLESKVDSSGNMKTVENKSETWSIDPIEDEQFFGADYPVAGGLEYLNPHLGASRNSPQPPDSVNGSSAKRSTIGIGRYGRYRITRRLSAKGRAVSDNVADRDCTDIDANNANRVRVSNAKKWVEQTSSGISQQGGGSVYFGSLNISPVSANTGQGIHLYNHIRSISTDFYNGSYEMTDTWIGMPAGTTHTESFTIDCSTNENFTKTVRVIGNVKGMSLYQHDAQNYLVDPNSEDVPIASKTRPLSINGSLGGINTNKADDLSPNISLDPGGGIPPQPKIDKISDDKYANAKYAWETLIKPMLYRRACLAMANVSDGRINRPNVNEVDPTRPESPAFFYERSLSPIPASTSEGHDPYSGGISYTYEFNNKYRSIPGVLSESINVYHDIPSDVVSEVAVIGRQLGPILYSFGKTASRKTLTIDIVVQPPKNVLGSIPNNQHCPVGLDTDLRSYIDKIVEGHTPFYPGDRFLFGSKSINNVTGNPSGATDKAAKPGTVYIKSNNETWNPTDGRFNKVISWVYQPCDVTQGWLDY